MSLHERVQRGLEGTFNVDVELAPGRAEELDAVVRIAVVRRRDHRAGCSRLRRGPGNGWCGHDAERVDGDALGREARGQCRLECRPRDTGVAAYDEPIDSKHASGRPTECDDELRSEIEVRHPPHPIRPEP